MLNVIELNREKIRQVVLTEEEIEEAIYQGKLKKYFHEKSKEYWEAQDSDAKVLQRVPESMGD